MNCQAFLDRIIPVFGSSYERERCLLDTSRYKYARYCEHRIDKELRHIRHVELKPQQLFVRMDIHQGKVGAGRRVHLDHARRLLTLLMYFCDYDEIELQGGVLKIHSDASGTESDTITVEPRDNRAVLFICCARSFHSVPKIVYMKSPRNYVQIHVSSSTDVWSH